MLHDWHFLEHLEKVSGMYKAKLKMENLFCMYLYSHFDLSQILPSFKAPLKYIFLRGVISVSLIRVVLLLSNHNNV